MDLTQTQLSAFNIAGIAVRTTNIGGQAQQDIGFLWQRFMHQKRITNNTQPR